MKIEYLKNCKKIWFRVTIDRTGDIEAMLKDLTDEDAFTGRSYGYETSLYLYRSLREDIGGKKSN